jgi:hypothetical protein
VMDRVWSFIASSLGGNRVCCSGLGKSTGSLYFILRFCVSFIFFHTSLFQGTSSSTVAKGAIGSNRWMLSFPRLEIDL